MNKYCVCVCVSANCLIVRRYETKRSEKNSFVFTPPQKLMPLCAKVTIEISMTANKRSSSSASSSFFSNNFFRCVFCPNHPNWHLNCTFFGIHLLCIEILSGSNSFFVLVNQSNIRIKGMKKKNWKYTHRQREGKREKWRER